MGCLGGVAPAAGARIEQKEHIAPLLGHQDVGVAEEGDVRTQTLRRPDNCRGRISSVHMAVGVAKDDHPIKGRKPSSGPVRKITVSGWGKAG